MALSHLPQQMKLQRLVCVATRHSGTLSKACAALSEGTVLLESRLNKRSRSVNKESASLAVVPYVFGEASVTSCSLADKKGDDSQFEYRETNPVSVMNLLALLEVMPSAQDRLLLFDYIGKSRKSVIEQYFDGAFMQGANSNTGEQIAFDGQFLDQIFSINEKDNWDSRTKDAPESSVEDCSELFSLYSQSIFDGLGFDNDDKPVSLGDDITDILKNLPWGNVDYDSCSKHDSVVPAQSSSELYSYGPLYDSPVENVVLFSSTSPQTSSSPPGGKQNKPNTDELHSVQDYLNEYLPKCFSKQHNFKIYSENILFENNFAEKPFITRGINAYGRELAKYRIYAHLRYANVRMQILKSTVQEEEGSVRIRWRVHGIPQSQAFMFWKFLPWNYKKSMGNEAEWLDGISTFYVQGHGGVIHRHRVDKVIPDEDVAADVIKNNLNVTGAV